MTEKSNRQLLAINLAKVAGSYGVVTGVLLFLHWLGASCTFLIGFLTVGAIAATLTVDDRRSVVETELDRIQREVAELRRFDKTQLALAEKKVSGLLSDQRTILVYLLRVRRLTPYKRPPFSTMDQNSFIGFMRNLLKTDLIIEYSEGGHSAWEVNARFEDSLKYILREDTVPA